MRHGRVALLLIVSLSLSTLAAVEGFSVSGRVVRNPLLEGLMKNFKKSFHHTGKAEAVCQKDCDALLKVFSKAPQDCNRLTPREVARLCLSAKVDEHLCQEYAISHWCPGAIEANKRIPTKTICESACSDIHKRNKAKPAQKGPEKRPLVGTVAAEHSTSSRARADPQTESSQSSALVAPRSSSSTASPSCQSECPKLLESISRPPNCDHGRPQAGFNRSSEVLSLCKSFGEKADIEEHVCADNAAHMCVFSGSVRPLGFPAGSVNPYCTSVCSQMALETQVFRLTKHSSSSSSAHSSLHADRQSSESSEEVSEQAQEAVSHQKEVMISKLSMFSHSDHHSNGPVDAQSHTSLSRSLSSGPGRLGASRLARWQEESRQESSSHAGSSASSARTRMVKEATLHAEELLRNCSALCPKLIDGFTTLTAAQSQTSNHPVCNNAHSLCSKLSGFGQASSVCPTVAPAVCEKFVRYTAHYSIKLSSPAAVCEKLRVCELFSQVAYWLSN